MTDLILRLNGGAVPALEILLQATLVLGVASLVAWRRRQGSAAWRHGVWLAAFALVAALPLSYGLLPRPFALQSSALAEAQPSSETEAIGTSSPFDAPSSGAIASNVEDPREEVEALPTETLTDAVVPIANSSSSVDVPALSSSGSSGFRPQPAPLARLAEGDAVTTMTMGKVSASTPTLIDAWPGALLALWALGALFVLARGAAGHWRVRQWLRQSRRAGRDLRRLGAEAAEDAGLPRPLPLLETSAVGGPALVGVLRPRVLLPRGLAEQVESRVMRPLILHESMHAARRDHWIHGALQLVRALLWFHPLAHLGLRAVARDRELLTDAAVVRRLGRRSDYAEGILHVMRSRPLPFAAALGVADARGEEVEERLEAIVGGEAASWRRPGRLSRGLAAVGFIALAALVTATGLQTPAAALSARSGEPVLPSDAEGVAVQRSDEPVLVIVNLPEPRPRSGRVGMLGWPEWRRASAGRYVVDGQPLGFAAFKKALARYGIGNPEMQRASDAKQSRADLILQIHRDRAASDVADVIGLARSAPYGIRQLRLSLVGEARAAIVLPPPVPAVADEKASLGRDLDGRIAFTLPQKSKAVVATTPEAEALAVFTNGLRAFMRAESLSRVHLTWAPEITATQMLDVLEVLQPDMRARLEHVAGRTVTVLPSRASVPTAAVTSSLASGLTFLASVQNEKGAISADTTKDEALLMGRTALALLAFIEAGSTHQQGEYAQVVKKGLAYLLRRTGPNASSSGCLAGEVFIYRNYAHAVATMVIAKLLRQTSDAELRLVLKAAVDYILDAQNPYMGWRYEMRDGDNDTSMTTWMTAALLEARSAGLEIPRGRLESAQNWFDNMLDEESGRVGYNKKGGMPVRSVENLESHPAAEVETPTAMALGIWARLGRRLDKNVATQRGAALVGHKLPLWSEPRGSIDFIYWYWGTVASRSYGPEMAPIWNRSLQSALVPNQCMKGKSKGSWNPVGAWGSSSGRVGSTALALMALMESRQS